VEHTYWPAFCTSDVMALLFHTSDAVVRTQDAVKCSGAPEFNVILELRTRHLFLFVLKYLDQLTVGIVVNFQEAVGVGAVLDVIDEQIVKLLVGEL
jgi:hypothetical protein